MPGGADGLIDAALLDEQAISAVRDGGRIAFPADQAPEAHRILEAGGTRGRLILEF